MQVSHCRKETCGICLDELPIGRAESPRSKSWQPSCRRQAQNLEILVSTLRTFLVCASDPLERETHAQVYLLGSFGG